MKQNILALVGFVSWVAFSIREQNWLTYLLALIALFCFAEVAKMAPRGMEARR